AGGMIGGNRKLDLEILLRLHESRKLQSLAGPIQTLEFLLIYGQRNGGRYRRRRDGRRGSWLAPDLWRFSAHLPNCERQETPNTIALPFAVMTCPPSSAAPPVAVPGPRGSIRADSSFPQARVAWPSPRASPGSLP